MSSDNNIKNLTFEQLNKVRAYLKKMIEVGGSDLHIKANSTVRVRINGKITPFSGGFFSKEDALTFAKELLRGEFAKFVEQKELDTVYVFDEKTRFRVNIFFQMDGVSAVFRIIPMKIPQLKDLNFPEVVEKFVHSERGLVLVTGVTGSGKSTTLASIINEINLQYPKHIITIEDPIEFVHRDKKCIINQRSVGHDTLSFSNALRGALREDPDIILVGEMRDLETIKLALHAADTGHLVFSTLHTLDAKETINRIISQFPSEEQNAVRLSLANVLQGVISQRLIPTVDGKRRAAMEILVRTPTIEKLILENRDYEIKDAIEKGKGIYQSQSFDQHILDLYQEGVIDKKTALEYATSASDMELRMSGIGDGSASLSQEPKSSGVGIDDEDIFDLKS
ncbi:Twitching motility protein PilT [hydrothermal vent metagenome]|uniref:Twitching motility protein PilT n=1 Tax=hydrothermal vent metagenome TaxID=652676 RepID=A0A1W1C0V2_9ZZZZ